MTVVRARFAPSPTGSLHLGGARTALFNYLLVRGTALRGAEEASLVLRIDDTDANREAAGSDEAILRDLRWLGVNWDEGPDVAGPHVRVARDVGETASAGSVSSVREARGRRLLSRGGGADRQRARVRRGASRSAIVIAAIATSRRATTTLARGGGGARPIRPR